MRPSSPQQPENDWPIISSYTDAEAVEDGTLIDLTDLNVSVSPREDRGEVIPRRALNRMTRGAYYALLPQGPDHAGFIKAWLEAKLEAAVYLRDMWQVPATEHTPALWFLPNEVGGWTVMRPEDY
jgi:hypothetical protein